MNLASFSTEQLNLFVHTLEGISRQLDDISVADIGDADIKRRKTLMAQAFVLAEQITLEIAHRSLVSLHAELGVDESATLEIARRSLACLHAQLGIEERTNP